MLNAVIVSGPNAGWTVGAVLEMQRGTHPETVRGYLIAEAEAAEAVASARVAAIRSLPAK